MTEGMTSEEERRKAAKLGLYSPESEHDACGVGFVANIKGRATHKTIEDALLILHNLDHRGAVGADPLCGDGAGILIQIPDAFYREEMKKQGVTLPPPGDYGVGMIFLPKEPASREACMAELERMVRQKGQVVLGWRKVPVDSDMEMSPTVRRTEPDIRQIFIGRGPDVMIQDALERRLYVIRKTASHRIKALKLRHGDEYFVPSMSTRTVVYKGLLLADQVGRYYTDLSNPEVKTAIAVVHQRFSTNTFPSWALAHPYRYIAHNGEINTVKGNANWIRARETSWKSAVLGDDVPKLAPLIYDGQSDTASLDNALELLVMSGYSLPQAVMMLVPEPWERSRTMDPDRSAFYAYSAPMMEAWDGPAAIVFTDGMQIGATLDRNGLRPARYVLTDDDTLILASEMGALPVPESRIRRKWRIEPGKMLLIDTVQGRIVPDEEVKRQVALAHPYREWVERLNLKLADLETEEALGSPAPVMPSGRLLELERAFGMTQEDLSLIVGPMAEKGAEPVGAMGDDAALPVLSHRAKPLFSYFRQLFAQVTNPPIDPIREELVTSLISFIGPKPNLLDVNNVNPPRRIEVEQPLLTEREMSKLHRIEHYTGGKFRSRELDITYPAEWGSEGVDAALASLCAVAADDVRAGDNILIITDRAVSRHRVSIPVLLAVSALHQHLIREGLRTNVGLVVESGAVFETMHFALLLGYGAEAVCPYVALAAVRSIAPKRGLAEKVALSNYVKAVGKGLTKIMAKMGISTLMSYRGARIFEAVGLSSDFVDRYFHGTPTKVEGLGLFEVMKEQLERHAEAYGNLSRADAELPTGGEYAWRADGEEHMWTPEAIVKLQRASREKSYSTYQEYASIINDQSRRQMTLRGLLDFRTEGRNPVPLEEVEPASEIVKRFATGAMSIGAISPEAHAVLAVAMNRIGAKSNTGEGGEDPRRYEAEMRTGKSPVKDGDTVATILGSDRTMAEIPLEAGDSLRSRIKQVASGRFGVTEAYLASADQIQIKMAQGAKPGEGGQLPGKKVTPYIAMLRYSVPGVGLISPPPHHDIYSIEDIAQLIHDLKCANPTAEISVKLVSETGVGTVAAGVVKAKADHIVISGADGGTGASPRSSTKHAGAPWELGLAEAQQTLVLNQLRDRVAVQVDGQMKTGRDVAVAALLGADEFGFATAPLVVEGCLMMRQCNLNTCPVGIATQDPELRRRFRGRPAHLVNYFFFVAEEVREIMARLGFRRMEEMIGRTDLLAQRKTGNPKADEIDLSRLLYAPDAAPEMKRKSTSQDHRLWQALDNGIIPKIKQSLDSRVRTVVSLPIRNVDRTAGTLTSYEIVKRFGAEGLPRDTVHLEFRGHAGQSFGAFAAPGETLELTGDANDYVGKGLSGGVIIIRAPGDFHGDRTRNIIAGNTTLYGATSGEAYFNGVAGERFAVRLSGASAVVEGVGDHGCEYMTGGTVVVLGRTGRNFASGMSGGVAYVLDEDGSFESRCNKSMVALERVEGADEQRRTSDPRTWHLGKTDEDILLGLVRNHALYTGSEIAEKLLENWENSRTRFVKVFPLQYRDALLKKAAE
ncbi:MAG: glutamate synthase-related protein [Sutterellaceae bacterium]|nr:glutamate synthase-related protein [Sutterellaceae bacterium]MDY2867952.1 glutamate synthase-related protein [Mesosutterella sp.]